MKLRYLNVLVSTVFAAGIVNAAEIYNKDGSALDLFGTFNSGYYLSDDSSKNRNRSLVRYGVFGKTQVNEHFVGFGMLEYEHGLQYVEYDNTKNGKVRLGYVGIKCGDFGQIDYGRNYGLLYDVGSWTDVMPEFGGDNFVADNFLLNRASNVFTYRNTNLFGLVNGLNFSLQYQGENNENSLIRKGRSLKESNGEGYGVSIVYNLDYGIAASVAYSNSKRTAGQIALDANNSVGVANNASAYSFGLKYDDNNVYLAALYGETRHMAPFGDFVVPTVNVTTGDSANDGSSVIDEASEHRQQYGFINKAVNIEFVAQYQFDFGLRPSVGYLHSRVDDSSDNSNNNYLRRYFEVGTTYNLNKNILTKVDYRVNLIKKEDNFVKLMNLPVGNVFSLGMSYTF
ncbi:porin [Blochmannia endosymbiont of Colobopsis nipponica]|uniref:porin n=1 Tax=Blochmannia endosymbiont of Colobopsis nipponica TaxID=2681987 RepID=UPI0017869076|nr:porin [Blochmannia endosymbiont of Colobopsis nipponica]QOI10988.1 porin [Blochmannia endosymbiont of Colobopsis nipponica]